MKWAQRIRRAEKRGIFTDKDRELASQWATCAIGERFWPDGKVAWKKAPRGSVYLGGEFNSAVYFNRVDIARKFYKQIRNLPKVLITERKPE